MINDRAIIQGWLCDALNIEFPYHSMGKIDSLHLFGESELVILAFYAQNRERYRNVLDIGGNLGLHSIMMARQGWNVKTFEPDYDHYARLKQNLRVNNCEHVVAYNKAVHTSDDYAHFIRVLDNLTGNHLEGYKDSYGPIERTIVPIVDCRPFIDWAHFAKIDCEGNEADILLTTTPDQMKTFECMIEVRNEENAAAIYNHFNRMDVGMWAQKIKWERVTSITQMPFKNREGSLFIGREPPFK